MSRKAKLDALYREIPEIECKGTCANQCTSQVPFLKIEAKRTGNKKARGPDCPHLEDGRCRVHPIRPLLCRIWGVSIQMPCPYGCRPTRYLSDEETRSIIQRAEKICGETFVTAATAAQQKGNHAKFIQD